ncbi:MAG: DUF4430 domain-containing protein [Clostridia bacterium]|nr:DUF4430 domain-containing protein [Clostridia bacterium]
MKHHALAKIFTLVLVLSLVLTAFVGCGKQPAPEVGATATVIVEDGKTYTVPLAEVNGSNLFAVLDYLKEKQGLTYEAASGFISAVDGLAQDAAAGKYIYLYTSVEEDFDVSAYAMTKTVGDKTLTSSGVGAAEMHVTDGAVIYIGTIIWS